MKYKTIIETDDIKSFKFFEDGNGKYIVGKDAGAENDEWIALYFTECEQERMTEQRQDNILDTFGDKVKQKVFHISDTDITFAEEIDYEEAQRRFGYAMNHIGVVAVRGGI